MSTKETAAFPIETRKAGKRAMFIRQLKRRDESGHTVFHMQKKSLKDTNKLEFMQIHICDAFISLTNSDLSQPIFQTNHCVFRYGPM